MLTREEFVLGLAPAIAVFPKEKPPPDTLEIYYRLVAHLPIDIWQQSVLAVLSTKSYGFPKPGDVLDAAVQVVIETRGMVSESWARRVLDDYRTAYRQKLAGQQAVPALESGR